GSVAAVVEDRAVAPSDQRDESISEPCHRFDETRRGGIVTQHGADVADVAAQQPLADVRVRPDRLHELGPWDQPLGVRRQIREHREGLWAERQTFPASPELVAGEVQSKGRKLDGRVGGHATSLSPQLSSQSSTPNPRKIHPSWTGRAAHGPAPPPTLAAPSSDESGNRPGGKSTMSHGSRSFVHAAGGLPAAFVLATAGPVAADHYPDGGHSFGS